MAARPCSSLSNGFLLFWQADEDGIAVDAHGISEDILAGGAAYYFAGANVELSTVPGTGQDFAFKFAFVEGAADVGTVVGKGVDAAIYFCQADWFALHFDGQKFAVCKVINFRYFYKV